MHWPVMIWRIKSSKPPITMAGMPKYSKMSNQPMPVRRGLGISCPNMSSRGVDLKKRFIMRCLFLILDYRHVVKTLTS